MAPGLSEATSSVTKNTDVRPLLSADLDDAVLAARGLQINAAEASHSRRAPCRSRKFDPLGFAR
jgi:hypothetical protein